jgi:hypothetical protein
MSDRFATGTEGERALRVASPNARRGKAEPMTASRCDVHNSCTVVRDLKQGTQHHLSFDDLSRLLYELRDRKKQFDMLARRQQRIAQAQQAVTI